MRRLARPDSDGAAVVVASYRGDMQPLLGCYQPRAADLLRPGDVRPLREQIAVLSPQLLEIEDPRALFNVNAPEDLLQAAALLGGSGLSNRT